jgi:hypothetical protein
MSRTEKVDSFELPSIHRHCIVCKQYICNHWTEMTEGCSASRVSKFDQLVQWTFGVWAGRGKNECPAVRSDDDSAAWYGSRKRRAILQGWRP